MNKDQLENGKSLANDLFEYFENYTKGKCTRDKSLEDVSRKIYQWSTELPINGYIQSGNVEKVLREILTTKKRNTEKSYIFDCQIHQNEIDTAERIYNRL